MPYPRNLINEGETVVLDLKPHWFFFWKHIVTGIPCSSCRRASISDRPATRRARTSGWPLGIVLLIFAGFVVEKYLDLDVHALRAHRPSGSSRAPGSREARHRDPARAHQQHRLPPEHLLRVIGAGDLDIESAGRDGQSHFDNVRHPDMVQQEIYRQMETNARRQAVLVRPGRGGRLGGADGGPGHGRATSRADRSKLAALRDQGHITPAEYEAKKAQLLERM